MLYVSTTGAPPGKGPFSARLFDLPENRISLIANRSDRAYQRLERRVHKFNSSCSVLGGVLRDIRAQRRNKRAFMFT
jgi:hypothetical protein